MDIPHVQTFGVELEPEWAYQHPRTIVGNALTLPKYWEPHFFDAVVTSPCYGNRMADHHEATDTSKRNTYRHQLGRKLSPDSSAAMQWGPEYREFHRAVWEALPVMMKPGGLLVLNMKDHIRGGKVQNVTAWHHWTLREIGFERIRMKKIEASGNRQGQNGQARVPHEWVMTFRWPTP